jgi:hypothetical protein
VDTVRRREDVTTTTKATFVVENGSPGAQLLGAVAPDV